MELFLPWKEKAVRRFALVLVTIFVMQHPVKSQNISPLSTEKNIRLSSNPITFREAIGQLTKITGLHFIYSADRVNTSHLLLLAKRENSLDDLLSLMGRQMNLTFKKQDRYIVIKSAAPIATTKVVPTKKEKEWTGRIQQPENTFASVTSFAEPILSGSAGKTTMPISNEYFKAYAHKLHVYFDTSLLRKLSVHELRKININTPHSGLFISAGPVINDYSAGAEIQAGLRSIYLVYSPGWLKTGQYHGAYGVGTNFLLSRNFSVSQIYTFATIRQEDEMVIATPRGKYTESRQRLSAKHHQLKFMLQYAITPAINVRVGPTFNLMKSTYSMTPPNDFVYEGVTGVVGVVGPDGNFTKPVGYNTTPLDGTRQQVSVFYLHPLETSRLWIGWEAGVSYRINIFERR